MGGFLEASWGVLEAYCAVWRPSWASWSDLGAIPGSCGQSQEPFGAILACEGPLRGRVTVPEAHATNPRSAQERPRAPGTPGVRPLKKLQPWLLAVAAAAQQHSCEPWGAPLRARGTVADRPKRRRRTRRSRRRSWKRKGSRFGEDEREEWKRRARAHPSSSPPSFSAFIGLMPHPCLIRRRAPPLLGSRPRRQPLWRLELWLQRAQQAAARAGWFPSTSGTVAALGRT